MASSGSNQLGMLKLFTLSYNKDVSISTAPFVVVFGSAKRIGNLLTCTEPPCFYIFFTRDWPESGPFALDRICKICLNTLSQRKLASNSK